MDRKTVLAAAGALVLTVVGGISALAVAFGGSSADASATTAAATESTVVITEYVDQAGNPLSSPEALNAQPPYTVVVPVQHAADEIVVVQGPSEATATAAGFTGETTGATVAAPTSSAGGYDDQYEDDDEYEGHGDEYEGHGDEYEGHGDEYEGGGHGDD